MGVLNSNLIDRLLGSFHRNYFPRVRSTGKVFFVENNEEALNRGSDLSWKKTKNRQKISKYDAA